MILTEHKIREAAKLAKSMKVYESFSEQIKYDLFISHSFKDKQLIEGLYQLFDEAGYRVYVDWIDDSNLDRTNVNEKTAALLKKRMNFCKALAYISTENTPSSKWCPWELGFGDGKLGLVCILPVMQGSYIGQEYLGLYPYLDYETPEGETKKDFWVNDPRVPDKYIRLKCWLGGESLEVH